MCLHVCASLPAAWSSVCRCGVVLARRFCRVVISEVVTVDLTGQAAFEAGVSLWEMAFRRHPITSYPLVLDVKSRDEVDSCTLTAGWRLDTLWKTSALSCETWWPWSQRHDRHWLRPGDDWRRR